MKNKLLNKKFTRYAVAAAVTVQCAALSASAADINKADNADALNLTTSWVGGVAPGASDTAVWDSTVTSANSTALGADTTWNGIRIADPAGLVTISSSAGATNTLTLRSAGIDMSVATADLTLNNDVSLTLGYITPMVVGAGRTLDLTGAFTRPSQSIASFDNTAGGTIHISGLTTNTYWTFSTLNRTDVAATDGSQNIVPAATVVNGGAGYDANTVGGAPASDFIDVVNAATNGPDVSQSSVSASYYPSIIRFNTPQPYRNYWQWDVANRVCYIDHSLNTAIIVTPNVGANDVRWTGTANAFRFNHGRELIIDQDNPAGTFYLEGATSDRLGNGLLTKTGVGRVVWDSPSGMPQGGATRILAGSFYHIDGNSAHGAIRVYNGGKFAGNGTYPAGMAVYTGGTLAAGDLSGSGVMTINGNAFQLGAGSRVQFYGAGVPATNTTALMVYNTGTGPVDVGGTVTVDILSGTLNVGHYPLIYSSTGFSQTNTFVLGLIKPHVTAYVTNLTANTVDLVVTSVNQPLTWTAGTGTWDKTTANWQDTAAVSTAYQENTNSLGNSVGDSVLFNDLPGSGPFTVTLNQTLTPSSVTVDAASDYTFTGGDIAGTESFTKSGSGTLTLPSYSFSGGININGGTVVFSTLGNLGTGPINFGGGTLQYNGNSDDISARTVTFDAGDSTINDGGVNLNFANPIGNGGAGGFTKAGSGTLTLNGTNDYSGNTVVAQGTLVLGTTNTSISASSAIIVDSGATLDAGTSGVGIVLNSAANQILAGSGTVQGVVSNELHTTITPGTNGVYGVLTFQNDLTVNGGTLVLDVSATNSDQIAVSGGLNLVGGILNLSIHGTLANGNYPLMTFSSLTSGAGSSGHLTLILSGFNEPGHTAYLTDNGTQVNLVVANSASDHLTWSGTDNVWGFAGTMDWLNGSTAWAFTNGDYVTFDDSGSAQPVVNLNNAVQPTTITVNNTVDYTFNDGTGAGAGKITGTASLVKTGSGTLTINTEDDNTGGTLISSGTVQVGGDIGIGNITNDAALVFNQTADHSVPGTITGTGSLTQNGASTLTLTKDNTYSGPTTIASSGTIRLGDGLISTGTLGTGDVANDGSLVLDHVSGSYTLPNNITGSGGLTKLGAATVSLGGNLTYQGDTSISAGMFKINSNDQLPSAKTVAGSTGLLVVNGGATDGGTVQLNGFDQTVNGLSGSSGTVLGAINNEGGTGMNTLTINNTLGTNMSYSGQINNGSSGQLALNVLGVGSGQIIAFNTGAAGQNTYSGGTVISNAFVSLGDGYWGDVLGSGTITLAGNDHTTLAMERAVAGSSAGTGSLPEPIVLAPNTEAQFVTGCRPYGTTPGGVSGPASSLLIWNNHYSRSIVDGDWSQFYGTIEAGSFNYGLVQGDFTLGGGNSGFAGFPNARVKLMAAGSLMGNHTVYTNAADAAMYSYTGAQTYHFGELSSETGTTIDVGGSTLIIGSLGTDSTISGAITNGANLVKEGTGTLTLLGGAVTTVTTPDGFTFYTNTAYANLLSYTGTTTISNGVLKVAVPDALTNGPTTITLAAPTAVLNASDMGYISNYITTTATNQYLITNGVFEVVSGQTLSGLGTIQASKVMLDAGSTLNVGLPTGVLTTTHVVEMAGAVNISLNRDNTPNSGELSAPSFTIDPTATLVITNVGADLVNGDHFTLFNQLVDTNQFASVTLPATDSTGTSTYVWQNNLAVDGTITLLSGGKSPVNPNPGTIMTSISGNVLTLSWPTNSGWTLQMQTNNLTTGLSTNWMDVPGSTSITSTNITVDPGQPTVFYRLKL